MPDTTADQKRLRFRELHESKAGFIIPNPWDAGSARVLAALGFEALATTSFGAAAALGRIDGELTRNEAIEHARALDRCTDLPVSADLENGFGASPDDVTRTVRAAIDAGLAGCSIEDYGAQEGLYPFGLAVDRVRAAVAAIPAGGERLLLTARAENHLRGHPDLSDTIKRLQAFQEAGADVLYAPALKSVDEIAQVLGSIDRPLNVLLVPGGPSAARLMAMGVRRVSVGGALATASYASLVDAAEELRAGESHAFYDRAASRRDLLRKAWGRKS